MRKAYEEYKATGIQWLPNIPKHWEILKLRQILSSFSEKNHPDMPLLSVVREKGVIIRNTENTDENHNYIPDDLTNYKLVKTGQFAMNKMKAWQGSYGVSDHDGIVSPAYFVFNFVLDIDKHFFNTAIRSKSYVNFFGQASDGIRVGQWDLSMARMKYIPFYVPPRDEQEQIVRFLDWKVSCINRLINILKEKKRLILELRQANINYAMYPQKDWTLAPLKQYALSNQAALSSTTPEETIIKYIDINTVGNGYLKNKPEIYTFKDAPLRARRIIHSGDTIVSTVRTYLRSVCFLNNYYEGCVASTGFSVLTPKIGVMPELLGFALTSDYFISQVVKSSTGVSYPAISDNKLMRLQVAFPSELYKQKLLVEKINKMNQKVVSLTNYITQQITNLHDLKSSLIADVVTGQIDVRDVEIPDYEQVAESLYEADDNATLHIKDEIPEEV